MSDEKIKMDEMLEQVVENEDDYITLTDEGGVERTLEIVAELQLPGDDNWYIILAPVELMEDETDETVYVFRSILEEGAEEDDEVFEPVEDEKLVDKIFAEYEKLCNEEE